MATKPNFTNLHAARRQLVSNYAAFGQLGLILLAIPFLMALLNFKKSGMEGTLANTFSHPIGWILVAGLIYLLAFLWFAISQPDPNDALKQGDLELPDGFVGTFLHSNHFGEIFVRSKDGLIKKYHLWTAKDKAEKGEEYAGVVVSPLMYRLQLIF